MSDYALRVRRLGKRYRLGATASLDKTFRELIYESGGHLVRSFRREAGPAGDASRDPDNHIWALRDLSFDLRHGEILGIVGRNGAGKSTLLKILSRITDPTEGEAEIFGRVGSLLEVGTGFHPELTGRENVFLNGAVLGMRRSEIKRKLDAIIDFAEIERFMDTPVKRYSSGMYVRLAFAVAAHLEPDILIVDEVLAVGDARFQEKCLGKMGETASAGRTILFVSHNLGAVKALCSRAILVENGGLAADGRVDEVLARYLEVHTGMSRTGVIPEDAPRATNGQACMRRVELTDLEGSPTTQLHFGQPFRVCFECDLLEEIPEGHFEVSVSTVGGIHILYSSTIDGGQKPRRLMPGRYRVAAEVDGCLLPRQYTIDLGVHHQNGVTADFVQRTFDFTVLAIGQSRTDHYPWQPVRGHVRAPARWSIETPASG